MGGSVKKTRQEQNDELTDMVMEALQRGKLVWQRPRNESKCGTPLSPLNPVTGAIYRAGNFLRLALDPRTYRTGDPRYCTFKNCVDDGWHVRKNEHGIHLKFSSTALRRKKITSQFAHSGERKT